MGKQVPCIEDGQAERAEPRRAFALATVTREAKGALRAPGQA